MLTVAELALEWRQEAELFRRRGLDRAATMVESYADQLERRLNTDDMATCTVPDATVVSGYSESALYQMIRDDQLENVGTATQKRLRVADLPRKPPPKRGQGYPALISGVRRLRVSK